MELHASLPDGAKWEDTVFPASLVSLCGVSLGAEKQSRQRAPPVPAEAVVVVEPSSGLLSCCTGKVHVVDQYSQVREAPPPHRWAEVVAWKRPQEMGIQNPIVFAPLADAAADTPFSLSAGTAISTLLLLGSTWR